MKSKSRAIPIALIAVALAIGGWLLLGPKPDDPTLIKEALDNAVKASKEGRPGGVVEYLSNDVVVNGRHYNVGTQLSKAIRQYHPEISLGEVSPEINADTATVTSPMKFSVLSKTIEVPDVTFTLQKQSGTTWLVFPVKTWKVTGAKVPEEAVQKIIDEMPGIDALSGGGGLW